MNFILDFYVRRAPPPGVNVNTKLCAGPREFLKIDEFHTGENRGKQEIIRALTPRKQCQAQKQLPPLSLIN